MTEHSVDPQPTHPTEDVAVLRARLDELQRRNTALEEAAGSPPHRPVAVLRSIAVVVLVTLGALMATASVPTIWGRNLVLDTDRYVATLQPLASNPGVRSAV